ncbi:MAG: hypothetical protein DWI29_04745 [Planctomycetota bacterium]|nr:MAG: hypothetical protein DWI29_04745 [Planctomycetota bacterium]
MSFNAKVTINSLTFSQAVTHSGRLVLSEERRSKYLSADLPNQPDSVDRGHGRKRILIAVNSMTPAGLVEGHSMLRSM